MNRHGISSRAIALAFAAGFGALLGGCSAFDNPKSPDVLYSRKSADAKRLQVPPDLTGVGEGEQFVLPGTTPGPVNRNTLLPQFESVRYVREGAEAWLAFEQTPEDLWPRLIEWLDRRGYTVDETRPVDGTIATRWRPAAEVEQSGVLGKLIGGGDSLARVGFRLERAGTGATAGSRLFARSQVAKAKAVEAGTVSDWPASSSDPERTATLLADFLVYLGVDEQRSRGLIDAATAADVLDGVSVRTTSAGSQLVVHHGYASAFEMLSAALESTGRTIESSDGGLGRIGFVADQPLLLTVVPVHLSAVRVGVTDREGRRLDPTVERDLLDTLRAALV